MLIPGQIPGTLWTDNRRATLYLLPALLSTRDCTAIAEAIPGIGKSSSGLGFKPIAIQFHSKSIPGVEFLLFCFTFFGPTVAEMAIAMAVSSSSLQLLHRPTQVTRILTPQYAPSTHSGISFLFATRQTPLNLAIESISGGFEVRIRGCRIFWMNFKISWTFLHYWFFDYRSKGCIMLFPWGD